MEDIIHQFHTLTADMDDDDVAGLIIALMAGFCVTFAEDDAEALSLLLNMHHDAADLIMYGEEEGEMLH